MSADIEAWPPPTDPVAFESLCLDLWKEIWADPAAQKNGRSGQLQRGVDVFGNVGGRQVGVQCKQKDGLLRSKLTVKELDGIIEEAKQFRPPLAILVVATTGARDVSVQERARIVSETHKKEGLFAVEVWSWQDIWHELYQRDCLLRRIAPTYWPALAAANKALNPSAPTLSKQLRPGRWFLAGAPLAILLLAGLAVVHFRREPPGRAGTLPAETGAAWQPPELPANCTNVLISFGGLTVTVPLALARIPADPSSGKFPLKDVPPEFTRGLDTLSNYSPRIRHLWLRRTAMTYRIGGKEIEFPIVPLVKSNRLFVQVDMPFQNTKRTILMSDDFDSELSGVPRLWDRNYSSNIFELVNEHTNPILQVVYKRPNEVQVNGIFLVDTYDLLVSFGALPALLSPQFVFYDNQSTQTVDPRVLSQVSTNLTITVDTNAAYGIPFPNQKAIFKYPSWKYPGVAADAAQPR